MGSPVGSPRFAVVGGGIIGTAVARELSTRPGGAEVTIFEKEGQIGAHQTSHNSGVVHAGLYYEPGSLKAALCRRGVALLKEYCEAKSLPYDACGKLVIAHDEVEVGRLQAIFERAKANNVPGVRMITGEGIAEIEPNAVGVAALHSPHTAIIDYLAVARSFAEDVVRAGGRVLYNQEVTRVSDTPNGALVVTDSGEEEFDQVIVCAGLQSDRLARASGDDRNPRIVPFFGEYFLLEPKNRDVVRGLIYPVPDPKYPFLGVHLTKRIDGEMLIGPNAFVSFGREDYKGSRFSIRDMAELGTFPGFWKFSLRNLPAAARELRTVLNAQEFVREAARFVPSLAGEKLVRGTRGVRAQAMSASGELLDDFVITQNRNVTHIRNAPSPGATSSMAIAEHIVDRVVASRN